MQWNSCYFADQTVCHDRGQSPVDEGILAVLPPAAYDVEPLFHLLYYFWNICRIVLQVGIQRDDDLSLGFPESCAHCRSLTEITAELDQADMFVFAGTLQHLF